MENKAKELLEARGQLFRVETGGEIYGIETGGQCPSMAPCKNVLISFQGLHSKAYINLSRKNVPTTNYQFNAIRIFLIDADSIPSTN